MVVVDKPVPVAVADMKPADGVLLSASFKDLVTRMLSSDPEKRPSLSEVWNSEWIQGFEEIAKLDDLN